MSEEFLDGNGNPGAERLLTSAADVAAEWKRWTSRIPASFAVGVGLHESSYTLNERDTEPSGKQTGGVFQLTLGGTSVDAFGDATRAGFPDADVFTLEGACKVLASLAESWLDKLEAAAGGLDDASFFAQGGAGYLAWAHNAGLGHGQALDSVTKYGLDWSASLARNAGTDYFDNHIGPYGNDCISGGPDWTEDMGAPLDPADAPLLSARNEARVRVGLLVLLLALLVALQWPKLLGGKVAS